jgi:alkylhydroperoxidase family enzyme
MKPFSVPTKEQVAPVNQIIFDNLTKALGFVPNLYATIAYSSNGLERFLAYQNAKTSLTNKEKEAINLIVSQVNGCVYLSKCSFSFRENERFFRRTID